MVLDQSIFTALLLQHIGTRLVIGQHVAATETVNRLFRIAHHDHTAGFDPVRITPDFSQQIILILVGILKFIDQNQWITCLYKLGKTLTLLSL